MNLPIRHCLHFIQNTILKNCRIYYIGHEQDFIHEMEAFINKENNIHHIDIKWVFDCFFKFKKCEEGDFEYKI